MERLPGPGLTPVFVRAAAAEEWPAGEKCFYVLARDGLFLCRNHEFFRSCVPAPRWPSELAAQGTFLEASYPRLAPGKLEQVVGFFDCAWRRHGGEAGVILAWSRRDQAVQVIVPRQVATVWRNGRGGREPIGLHYELPASLPPDLTVFCDLHSHCDFSAYASSTDVADETHRPGLHAVVGRLDEEPPSFHAEAVVDGVRFRLDAAEMFSGYRRRRFDFPRGWLRQLEVREQGAGARSTEGKAR